MISGSSQLRQLETQAGIDNLTSRRAEDGTIQYGFYLGERGDRQLSLAEIQVGQQLLHSGTAAQLYGFSGPAAKSLQRAVAGSGPSAQSAATPPAVVIAATTAHPAQTAASTKSPETSTSTSTNAWILAAGAASFLVLFLAVFIGGRR